MRIYFIRHTAPNIAKGICYGQTDLDIMHTFTDEIKKINKKVGRIEFDKIYSSPLQRCSKLATELFGDNYMTDDRLKELSFGDWEMVPWHKINRQKMDIWGNDWVNEVVPNGESFRQLYDRVVEFLKEVEGKGYENVAIVTHSGVMRAARVYAKKEPIGTAFDIKLKYGEVMPVRFT